MKRYYIYTALAFSAFPLSGCWFNSAGYVFDKAHYKAASNTSSLTKGSEIYKYKGKYYIRLPRNKVGTEPRLMLSTIKGVSSRKRERNKPDGYQNFRISATCASYMLGQGGNSRLQLEPISSNTPVIKGETLTVVCLPDENVYEYKRTTPWAWLIDVGGVLECLCVDLPISVTCSTFALTGTLVGAFGEGLSEGGRAMNNAANSTPKRNGMARPQPMPQSHGMSNGAAMPMNGSVNVPMNAPMNVPMNAPMNVPMNVPMYMPPTNNQFNNFNKPYMDYLDRKMKIDRGPNYG